MSLNDFGRSRREFVRSGVGALAAGTAAGVAGCSGVLGGSDSGTPFEGAIVADYSFDDGGGETASDGSGNGNDATVVGASWTDQGKVAGALSFDGEDDVVETPVEFADLAGGLTFEAWARHDDLSGGWGWVFTQREPADQWSQMGVHSDGGGKLRWELLVGDGTQATVDAPAGSITEGTWHHWAGTWAEGEGLRLYIDAELVATSTESKYCDRGCGAANSQPLASEGPINIGGQGRELEYWQGAIDEATVYERALSADEVGQLYDSSSQG